jgi:hypothetical protein
MATTAKALATARELIDLWTKEVASTLPVIVLTFEAVTGNPIITLSADSTPATGEKVVVVRISPIAWTATDILGNASQVYTPHKIDFCTELNYAATNDNIADILTPVELLPVIGEIVKRGMLVNWYTSANGTVPAVAQMTTSNLKASFSDLYWSAQKAQ